MKNPVTRSVTIAGMFNYVGGYACMYYMPAFFQQVYPNFRSEFASINAFSISLLGFVSAVLGGIISDRF
jgi:nitrate/nitrite transporter NarK